MISVFPLVTQLTSSPSAGKQGPALCPSTEGKDLSVVGNHSYSSSSGHSSSMNHEEHSVRKTFQKFTLSTLPFTHMEEGSALVTLGLIEIVQNKATKGY